LGSATVICADKTGTLTQNKMSVAYLYDAVNKISVDPAIAQLLPATLIEYAMWASETKPFDPMEKAIYELYGKMVAGNKRESFKQVHEYPLGGKPPMMTHIFENETGEIIIAAKGAPEAILRQTNLPAATLKNIEEQSTAYAREGYRVLGVGKTTWLGKKWPTSQEEFELEFLGLVAFYDPPKENIAGTIKTLKQAGIVVKMITGDYAATALAIARQVRLPGNDEVLTGKEVLELTANELQQKVEQINIYARMFPEAKLRVIDALKANGEIVAMTGDGVNDGPALKAAHIGIAMGLRGSEVAKQTASLILTDDDLGHMTDAVALGRKIYDNLKKAIQYIVSIHIPILLIVTLPLLFFWKYNNIFSPVHVIFLELLMGPTCSIVFESEPMEAGTMLRPPRKHESTFLSGRQLAISIVQGLLIAAGCLGLGYYYTLQQQDETTVRTIIFITLLFSNIFLTLSNRSFYYSVFVTMRYKNNLVLFTTSLSLLFIAAFLYEPHVKHLFQLHTISPKDILTCVVVSLVCTFWIEIWKFFKRKNGVVI
jgi:Ca2+-transporting ATPase